MDKINKHLFKNVCLTIISGDDPYIKQMSILLKLARTSSFIYNRIFDSILKEIVVLLFPFLTIPSNADASDILRVFRVWVNKTQLKYTNKNKNFLERTFSGVGRHLPICDRCTVYITPPGYRNSLAYLENIYVKPKRGDIIFTENLAKKYRNEHTYIFDGDGVIPLEYDVDIDEYGYVPREFCVPEFNPTYWKDIIQHNQLIWIDEIYCKQLLENACLVENEECQLNGIAHTYFDYNSNINNKNIRYRIYYDDICNLDEFKEILRAYMINRRPFMYESIGRVAFIGFGYIVMTSLYFGM